MSPIDSCPEKKKPLLGLRAEALQLQCLDYKIGADISMLIILNVHSVPSRFAPPSHPTAHLKWRPQQTAIRRTARLTRRRQAARSTSALCGDGGGWLVWTALTVSAATGQASKLASTGQGSARLVLDTNIHHTRAGCTPSVHAEPTQGQFWRACIVCDISAMQNDIRHHGWYLQL